jgi:hypothetical protein
MNKPTILILGSGRCGKDSFAELLVEELPDLTFTSSSWALAELIYEDIGKSLYPDVKSCFDDRHSCRDTWYRWVCQYNTPDKSRLTREILSKSNCYVGQRDLEEYQASKHLFNFIFYVDASERVRYVDETMRIPYNPKEMIKIDNNKDLENLKHQAKIAAEIIKGEANLILVDPGNLKLKRLLQTKAPWE